MSETRKARIIFLLIIIAALGLGAGGFYFYQNYWNIESYSAKSAKSAEGTDEIVARVEKLIILPKDEKPTVASVTDPVLLKDQPFFAGAKIGDKVLIYTKNKKAVLYRPDINKIVEVSALSLDLPQ